MKDTALLVFATSKTSCHRLTFKPNQLPISTEEPESCTEHEEADTRLIFHAYHAGAHNSTVVIMSSDTDVAVAALAHSKNISRWPSIVMMGTTQSDGTTESLLPSPMF